MPRSYMTLRAKMEAAFLAFFLEVPVPCGKVSSSTVADVWNLTGKYASRRVYNEHRS